MTRCNSRRRAGGARSEPMAERLPCTGAVRYHWMSRELAVEHGECGETGGRHPLVEPTAVLVAVISGVLQGHG